MKHRKLLGVAYAADPDVVEAIFGNREVQEERDYDRDLGFRITRSHNSAPLRSQWWGIPIAGWLAQTAMGEEERDAATGFRIQRREG